MSSKAIITSEFFCSYFWHSAIHSWKMVQQQKETPDKFYHGIAAIILFQCTLESYINHMIYSENKDTTKVKITGKDKPEKLIKISIKDKWIEFPRILTGQTFDIDQQPFYDFKQLIDLRNDLIHFKTKDMIFEVELPKPVGQITVGEIREALNQLGILSGHILMDIMPVAIAAG